jgi:hypothetical protein
MGFGMNTVTAGGNGLVKTDRRGSDVYRWMYAARGLSKAATRDWPVGVITAHLLANRGKARVHSRYYYSTVLRCIHIWDIGPKLSERQVIVSQASRLLPSKSI